VIGFSAGAHVSAVLSNNHSGRAYPRVDTADDMSCRPDFAMLIYPGYIAIAEKDFAPAPETALKDPPPTFIVMAQDDPVHVENALLYYMELQKAGVSAEMHLYARGGHGFALRRSELPASTWPARAADWLHAEIMAGRN
jgi:acetyl esterase/lipase